MYYAKWSITYTGTQKLLILLIIDSRIRVIKRYDIHTHNWLKHFLKKNLYLVAPLLSQDIYQIKILKLTKLNNIVGIPILMLAMARNLSKKSFKQNRHKTLSKTIRQKLCQKYSLKKLTWMNSWKKFVQNKFIKKFIKKISQKNQSKKFIKKILQTKTP